jgi:hypothetical protein
MCAVVAAAESVGLAAVVDVGHKDAAGLIETEKDAPLAHTQAGRQVYRPGSASQTQPLL